MASVKKLAGQTFWYGTSSIVARFFNYLLTPYLTKVLTGSAYGEMSLVYAAIPFMNILFLYGLETAYFRFSRDKEQEQKVYNTTNISLILSTLAFLGILMIFREPLARVISLHEHPEYITWSALIIALDALASLAFARLRFHNRPRKFAFIRVAGILINILAVYFFLSVCPALYKKNPHHFLMSLYSPSISAVGYVIIANIIQSGFSFLLLAREFFSFGWQFSFELWKQIMRYSLPLIIVGLGGIVNETADRLMLGWWSRASDVKFEVGAYSACYKLSILITLSVQAFRMAAEPFFFKVSLGSEPQKVYARIMNLFVIVVSGMFLAVTLYLDIWKHFIQNPLMWKALGVVPVLLVANIFLGIYYNLSIWFKLTNNTMAGAIITMAGAAITILINYAFIPVYGYTASAWATFACYGTMMIISYWWGQRRYPVPYQLRRAAGFLGLAMLLFATYRSLLSFEWPTGINLLIATVFMLLFVGYVLKTEREEFRKIPFLNKWI